MTVMNKLNEIANEIATEHAQGVCNHYGACELVLPFINYLQAKPEDLQDIEDWIAGNYDELYNGIFSGNNSIKEFPELHVSDVELWNKIVAEQE